MTKTLKQVLVCCITSIRALKSKVAQSTNCTLVNWLPICAHKTHNYKSDKFNWTQTADDVRLSSCDSAGVKGQLLACAGCDMNHVSALRLAPRSAQTHNINHAKSGHKWQIYAKRFIVLGAAINLRPLSVGRGRILSGARCKVSRSSCTSSLQTPCQGGLAVPGGAISGCALWGCYAIHMHSICTVLMDWGWTVYDHLTW